MTLQEHHTQTYMVASIFIQRSLQKLDKIAVDRQYSTVDTIVQVVSHIYFMYN